MPYYKYYLKKKILHNITITVTLLESNRRIVVRLSNSFGYLLLYILKISFSKSWRLSVFEHGPLEMIENKQLRNLNKEKKRREKAREKESQRERGMDVLGVREL